MFPPKQGPCAAVRRLGEMPYPHALERMRAFTARRTEATGDEVWLLTHPPVYTLGMAGKLEHLLHPSAVPVVRTDRGGQITYHGPGQLVAYLLFDLARARIGIRSLVRGIEQAVIDELRSRGITGARRQGMPGVYVADAKIAAVGLRVRRGCTYHGLSLNIECDLAPFAAINTCGYPRLADTSLRALGSDAPFAEIAGTLGARLGALPAAGG